MFDTIPGNNIVADSVSFFLRNDIPVKVVADTQQADFPMFEYLATDSTKLFFDVNSTTLTTHFSQTGFQGVALPFSPFIGSVIFLIFLACFVIFSIVFAREGTALIGNFKNIFLFGNRHHTSYKQQITTSEVWGEVFLILQSGIIFAIVLFVFSWDKGLSDMPQKSYFLFFVVALLLLAVFLGLKYVIYKAIGSFMWAKEMNRWIGRYFWIVELSGILSFFPAMFFVYIHEFREFVLVLLLVIFLAVRIVVITSLLMFFVKKKIGFFYFIVYLCGVEIAPYLFIYKGAVSFMNIIGSIALI